MRELFDKLVSIRLNIINKVISKDGKDYMLFDKVKSSLFCKKNLSKFRMKLEDDKR